MQQTNLNQQRNKTQPTQKRVMNLLYSMFRVYNDIYCTGPPTKERIHAMATGGGMQ